MDTGCAQVDTRSGIAGRAINVGTATPGSVSIPGYSANRVNVDIVDAAGLPKGEGFRTNIANATTNQLLFGQGHQFDTRTISQAGALAFAQQNHAVAPGKAER